MTLEEMICETIALARAEAEELGVSVDGILYSWLPPP